MNKVKFIILIIFFISITQSCALFSSKPKVSTIPEKSQLITSDIRLFYNAFDIAIKDTINASEIFDELYFSKGSIGLRDFYKLKIHSKDQFSDFVLRHRIFYEAIRNDILELSDLEKEIYEIFNRLETLYSPAVFPNVYFMIGRFTSNGTISKNGLLIGTEIISKTKDTNTENWNKNILKLSMDRNHIPITVAHELVHFNQDKMAKGNTLLWKSIKEGSAEFIAEIISGQTDSNFKDFKGQELRVWNDFKMDMHKSTWNSWQQASEKRPRNAGYWTGYLICKSYHLQVGDKSQAIYDILNIKDYDEFFKKSKVDEYIEYMFSN